MTTVADTRVTSELQGRLAAVAGFLRTAAGMPDPARRTGAADGNGADGTDGTPDALTGIVRRCGLSPFERDLLVLVAGCELDAALPGLCAAASGDPSRPFPTFGLALSVLPGAHWDAADAHGPLRAFALIDLEPRAGGLTGARLRMDERVLFALLGLDAVDGPLEDIADAEEPRSDALPARQADLVASLAPAWGTAAGRTVLLRGRSAADRRCFESSLAAAVGAPRLWRLAAADLPLDPADAGDIRRRLCRESILTGAVLVLDLEDAEPARLPAARRWAVRLAAGASRVILASRDPVSGLPAEADVVELPDATMAENEALLREVLGLDENELHGAVRRLTGQFRLSPDQLRAVARDAGRGGGDPRDLERSLWQSARARARVDLDGLAERVQPAATWQDLVLPPRVLEALHDLLRHSRNRATVHEDWRVTGSSRRGTGVSALFTGPSGTGKSLAAEVIAAELGVDLYHVDLSQVVSKYIGETEKNLRRVFDAAERGGAVLLIDEADALFGQRSEVKDSHDRYANIEVSYLLQRMESYRGLAILTTNLRANIDEAFERRLGFIVPFPFPDAEQRRDLWQRAFGSRAPVSALDGGSLAQLNLSGGSIRNVAVHAAFIAAERGTPVTMADVLSGARSEYRKLDRPLTSTELSGWPQ